jgi:hypothetical protein
MHTQKIKNFYDKANSYEKEVIENAILDRVKKDWKSIPEITKNQVLTLAKRHNRLNEFINL